MTSFTYRTLQPLKTAPLMKVAEHERVQLI